LEFKPINKVNVVWNNIQLNEKYVINYFHLYYNYFKMFLRLIIIVLYLPLRFVNIFQSFLKINS